MESLEEMFGKTRQCVDCKREWFDADEAAYPPGAEVVCLACQEKREAKGRKHDLR